MCCLLLKKPCQEDDIIVFLPRNASDPGEFFQKQPSSAAAATVMFTVVYSLLDPLFRNLEYLPVSGGAEVDSFEIPIQVRGLLLSLLFNLALL